MATLRRSLLFLVVLFIRDSTQKASFEATLQNLAENFDVSSTAISRSIPVNVSLLLHSFHLSPETESVTLSAEMQQTWSTGHEHLFLKSIQETYPYFGESTKRLKGNMWLPDLVPDKALKFQTLDDQDFFVFKTNGEITWNQIFQYEFPCKLDLTEYPLGEYTCYIKVQSGQTTKQLTVELKISTKPGWSIKHTVIPMIAAVTTAYLVFYLNVRGIVSRMITCGFAMLMATVIHENTYRHFPRAPYTMALEIFTGACMAFIWIAAVESVIVDLLSHAPVKRVLSSSNSHSFTLEASLTEEGIQSKGEVVSLWIDRCFRILFPASFIAFNAVYWVIYY